MEEIFLKGEKNAVCGRMDVQRAFEELLVLPFSQRSIDRSCEETVFSQVYCLIPPGNFVPV